jgi:hypothetical protein
MTWKNDLNKSEVMRSLIRVGFEKGMLKEDIVKQASTNLTPDTNLATNIIKLCTGLRMQGFAKYADDLEKKFMNYKKACALYDTSKEKGEDLIHDAHPKGSHKLENVAGDATIETILDQQLKDIQIINKMPNGKLSSAKEIIDAVKIVLAQLSPEDEKIALTNQQKAIKYLLRQAKSILTSGVNSAQYLNNNKITAPNQQAKFDEKLNDTLDELNLIFNKNITAMDLNKLKTKAYFMIGAYAVGAGGATNPFSKEYSNWDKLKDWGSSAALLHPATVGLAALYKGYKAYEGISDLSQSQSGENKIQQQVIACVKQAIGYIESAINVFKQPIENFLNEEQININVAPTNLTQTIAPISQKPIVSKPKRSTLEEAFASLKEYDLISEAQLANVLRNMKEKQEGDTHLVNYQTDTTASSSTVQQITSYLKMALNKLSSLFVPPLASANDPVNTGILNQFKIRVQKAQSDEVFNSQSIETIQAFYKQLIADINNWSNKTKSEIISKYPNTVNVHINWWNVWNNAQTLLRTAFQFNDLKNVGTTLTKDPKEVAHSITAQELSVIIANKLRTPLYNILTGISPENKKQLYDEVKAAINSTDKAISSLHNSENSFITFEQFKDKFMDPLDKWGNGTSVFTPPLTIDNVKYNCQTIINTYSKAAKINVPIEEE